MLTLVGVVIVLLMVLRINELFTSIKTILTFSNQSNGLSDLMEICR